LVFVSLSDFNRVVKISRDPELTRPTKYDF
jgi:hypothetical protein